MQACIFPGCPDDGTISIKMSMQRADTTSMLTIGSRSDWCLCAKHAESGMNMDIVIEPSATRALDVQVIAVTKGIESAPMSARRDITSKAAMAREMVQNGGAGNRRSRIQRGGR